MFRIQKLMLQEYRDVYEPVIVENPFTQVRACGEGLRQYHIGLTRSKIIFGCDDFDNVDLGNVSLKGVDPETETFQLVSLMPLKFLQFNFYRKRSRNIMQISICGEQERPMLFEFGGHLYKSLFWSIWRERLERFYIGGVSPFSSCDVSRDGNINYQDHAHLSYSSQSSFRSYSSNCSLMNH